MAPPTSHLQKLDMRVYQVDLDGELHDVRGQMAICPLVYHGDDYTGGQNLARALRKGRVQRDCLS